MSADLASLHRNSVADPRMQEGRQLSFNRPEANDLQIRDSADKVRWRRWRNLSDHSFLRRRSSSGCSTHSVGNETASAKTAPLAILSRSKKHPDGLKRFVKADSSRFKPFHKFKGIQTTSSVESKETLRISRSPSPVDLSRKGEAALVSTIKSHDAVDESKIAGLAVAATVADDTDETKAAEPIYFESDANGNIRGTLMKSQTSSIFSHSAAVPSEANELDTQNDLQQKNHRSEEDPFVTFLSASSRQGSQTSIVTATTLSSQLSDGFSGKGYLTAFNSSRATKITVHAADQASERAKTSLPHLEELFPDELQKTSVLMDMMASLSCLPACLFHEPSTESSDDPASQEVSPTISSESSYRMPVSTCNGPTSWNGSTDCASISSKQCSCASEMESFWTNSTSKANTDENCGIPPDDSLSVRSFRFPFQG